MAQVFRHWDDLVDHGAALWPTWLMWLTGCYGHIQSIQHQGSDDSCMVVMFPEWPKSVKYRWSKAPKTLAALWAPEISCIGILQVPQSTRESLEQQEHQWMRRWLCFPNMTLFRSPIPSFKVEISLEELNFWVPSAHWIRWSWGCGGIWGCGALVTTGLRTARLTAPTQTCPEGLFHTVVIKRK